MLRPSKASRAGTRCVSTLSSDQLTRKRANDREAQRAIRQRAKDHIEALERRIQELTEADGGDTAALVDAQERNRELERDLMELREKLRQTESPAPSFGEWSSDIEPSTTLNANDPYSSGSSSGRRGSYQYSSMPSARLGQPTVTDDAIHKQQFKLEQQSSNSLVQRPYGVPLPIRKSDEYHVCIVSHSDTVYRDKLERSNTDSLYCLRLGGYICNIYAIIRPTTHRISSHP